MKRSKGSFIAYIALAALVASGGAVAAFAGTSSSSTPSRRPATVALPKVQPCFGKALVRPRSYVIACADANTELASMHWTSWSSSVARAKGLYVYNTCTPTCVAGHFLKDPATISLSRPTTVGKTRVFTTLSISYKTGKTTARATYSLPTKPLGSH